VRPETFTPEEVLRQIAATPKYRHIAPETVLRLAAAELAKRRSPREAVKAVKNKLHQIYAAYVSPQELRRLERLLGELERSGAATVAPWAASVLEVCETALRIHNSTGERLPYYREFYRRIFALTGTPGRILDVACGLNPFSIPYMELPARAHYIGCDIDGLAIGYANRFLAAIGWPGEGRVQDVTVRCPEDPADLALVLKFLPVLEQQAPGRSLALLQGLRTRYLAVSFPLTSLGGRGKGMGRHYRQQYGEMLTTHFRLLGQFELPTELVYVLENRPPAGGPAGGSGITPATRDNPEVRSHGNPLRGRHSHRQPC